MKSAFKKAMQLICLAQAASDAGKGVYSSAHNNEKAVTKAYGIKDEYIHQAVAWAKKTSGRIVASAGFDDRTGMWVIYFDFRGGGNQRQQVSFHLPEYSEKEIRGMKIPLNGVWDRRLGGSQKSCRRLSQKHRLQAYSKSRS
jgi:hypothetical protein